MDKNIEIIEKELNNLVNKNYHSYAIFVRDIFGDNPNHFVDVTIMFNGHKDLVEVGIGKKDRRIVAYTQDGYMELIDLGFKENEIVKKYNNGEDNKYTSKDND